MFVPVACSACGQPFQVPDAAVGKPTVCPWCQATVPALPVGRPAAPEEHGGLTPPAQKEPLPLDDEPAPVAPRSGRGFPLWMIPVGLLVLFFVTVATVGVLRHKQGHLVGWEWKAFSPPDNSFTVELLGRPTQDATAEAGDTHFVSEGWYSGTVAWVGWRDLTQVQVQLAGTKDGWQHFVKFFDAERERLRGKYGGTVVKDATTKFENPLTHELRLDSPNGRIVERMIVVTGSRPRLYFVGIAGKTIDPDGEEAKRLFDSFRPAE